MKIAVEGCAHGELDKIYEALEHLTEESNIKIDLLIICGDFQAVRNRADMQCMAVPPKFRKLNTFHKYYSGLKKAPVLTIFIGGNHEASNYLSELPYGGWVCHNIYYLGYANVINIGGIRIAGLSGIYKGNDYLKGHFECPPYDESSKRSVYHVRNIDVFRLKQLKNHIDIVISHDWPRGVYNHGNIEELLRWKPFFKDEMQSNKLGSQPAEELLHQLQPSYWFAAHLHCKFAAVIPHENDKKTCTKFLALDKCLPRRKFLQVLDIGKDDNPVHIEYDPEWLGILRSTNHLLSISKRNVYMPGSGCNERWDFTVTDEEMQDIQQLFKNEFKVPDNFSLTAPPHDDSQPSNSEILLKPYINPQTESFCKTLKITDPLVIVLNNSNESLSVSEVSFTDTDRSFSSIPSFNPDEISLEDDDITKDLVSPREEEIDLDASDSGDFFIDTVGSHHISTNAQQFLHSQLCSTPVSATKHSDYFPELKEENLTLDKSETTNEKEDGPVKKFKRRNWSLYKSEDDTTV